MRVGGSMIRTGTVDGLRHLVKMGRRGDGWAGTLATAVSSVTVNAVPDRSAHVTPARSPAAW